LAQAGEVAQYDVHHGLSLMVPPTTKNLARLLVTGQSLVEVVQFLPDDPFYHQGLRWRICVYQSVYCATILLRPLQSLSPFPPLAGF